jgi:hypothetical protein
MDFHGDHTSTCTAHSGAPKAHDWMVSALGPLFRTAGHTVRTQHGVKASAGQRRGHTADASEESSDPSAIPECLLECHRKACTETTSQAMSFINERDLRKPNKECLHPCGLESLTTSNHGGAGAPGLNFYFTPLPKPNARSAFDLGRGVRMHFARSRAK